MQNILFIVLIIITFPASAQQLWGCSAGNRRLALIDANTRTGFNIATIDIDGSANGLAYDILGERLFVLTPTDDQLYMVDPNNGNAQELGPPIFTNNANGLAYDSTRDRLWVSNNSDEMFYYDLQTGVAVKYGDINGGTMNGDWEGLGYDPVLDVIYGVNDVDNYIYRIDPITVTAERVAGPLPDLAWRGLTFEPTSRHIFATGVAGGMGPDLYEIDPILGVVVSTGRVSGVDTSIQGLAAVPTPSTISILSVVSGICCRRPRRQVNLCWHETR